MTIQRAYIKTAECTKLNSFINRKYAMVRFYRLLLCLLFVSFNAAAYSGPKGLYTLEYPVNMPDVSVISENGMPIRIPSLRNDLTIMIFWSQSCFPCLREMKSLEKFYPKAAKTTSALCLYPRRPNGKIMRKNANFWPNTVHDPAVLQRRKQPPFLKPRHRFDSVHRHYEPQRQKSRNHSGRSRLEFRKTL